MTGRTQGETTAAERSALGRLDADSVERIDVHLERALPSEGAEKGFHVRHARQLLEACEKRCAPHRPERRCRSCTRVHGESDRRARRTTST